MVDLKLILVISILLLTILLITTLLSLLLMMKVSSGLQALIFNKIGLILSLSKLLLISLSNLGNIFDQFLNQLFSLLIDSSLFKIKGNGNLFHSLGNSQCTMGKILASSSILYFQLSRYVTRESMILIIKLSLVHFIPI